MFLAFLVGFPYFSPPFRGNSIYSLTPPTPEQKVTN